MIYLCSLIHSTTYHTFYNTCDGVFYCLEELMIYPYYEYYTFRISYGTINSLTKTERFEYPSITNRIIVEPYRAVDKINEILDKIIFDKI